MKDDEDENDDYEDSNDEPDNVVLRDPRLLAENVSFKHPLVGVFGVWRFSCLGSSFLAENPVSEINLQTFHVKSS